MEIRPILSALLRNKTGALLVAVQVAISMAILANALHIVNQRIDKVSRPSGIAVESTVFNINVRSLNTAGHEEQLAIMRREIATLRAVPGVVSVAQVSQIPMSRSGWTTDLTLDRKQVNETANASYYIADEALVPTWGLKILEGRNFTPSEVMEIDQNTDADPPESVIVTQALAQKMFPGSTSFVGKIFYFGRGEDANLARIVGVVERLQSQSAELAESSEFASISPTRLTNNSSNLYTLRVEPGQMDRVMREAEAAVRAATATPLVIKTETIEQIRKQRYRSDRTLSWMLVTVSGLLLLITASGIVGIASLWVTQRRKQIGVRRALGARRIDILRYFLTENFMITSAGVFTGVLLALALNHLLVTKLEMARLPVVYLLAGTGVFWLLGVIAVYGPAWRAASISPALATRST